MSLWPWQIVGKAQWSWVEASGLYVPRHFSFDELTTTQHEDLRARNREEARPYCRALLELVRHYLDPVRDRFGRVRVGSGFRGRELNARVGGSPTSQHCFGQAADFNVVGKENREGRIEVMRWLITDCRKRGVAWGQMLLEGPCIHVSLPGASHRNAVGYWSQGNSVEPVPELEDLA